MTSKVTSIRVTPEVGEFSDVEPGMVFVIPFTIHNISNSVKRVRFGPPKTNAFRLINTQQSIAPGMKQIVEVEFTSKEVKEFHDQLVVRTEEGDITIPLHAWFPAPNLVYDPVIDLDNVSLHHPVEAKKFKLTNIGKKDGIFRFSVEPHSQGLSLTPQSGVIVAGQTLDVSVHFFPSDPGDFRGVVNLNVDGEAGTRRLEVLAKVIESRVGLIDPKTQEAISRVSFGKAFFGQQRKMEVLLHNYGKHMVSFTVRPPEAEEAANADDESRQQDSVPIECTPTEGRIPMGEAKKLTFTFSPFLQESGRGWEHSVPEKTKDLSREWDVGFSVDIVETEQKIDVQLVGKALPTEVRLSESSFRFPDCPVNDHRDILFYFINESSELPVNFNLSRIAHFRCDPVKGKVAPKGKQTVLLTFHPNQLGSFRGQVSLSINDGAKVFPLTVTGTAVSIGPKDPLVGGPDVVTEDFQKTPKYAKPSSQPSLKFLKPKTAEDNEEMVEWMNEENPPDLLLMSEWQQKREHNRLYNHFVTNCRNIRHYNDKLKKGMTVDSNPDDIGMQPGEGLREPIPHVPNKEDPFPWAGLHSEADATKKGDPSMALRKAGKVDENKIIKKKFKDKPTNNEKRECKLTLSPKDLQNVVIPFKAINFGQVNVYSSSTKSFFVFNGLKNHILVNIPLSIRDELALSFPEAQVIPPGQLAGFDIVFRSETVQTFQQAIYFTINDSHKLKFAVFAEVIPIDVLLSQNELTFRFQEFGYDPSVTLPVTLTNPGNSEAEFQWTFPEGDTGAFAFDPPAGKVPAGSPLTVNVTYTPLLTSNETICTAALKVKGGVGMKTLKLSGGVQAASCSWSVKDSRLDFKKVPVGSVKSQIIQLKNQLATSAVFSFDVSQLSSCVSVTPLRGRIGPNDTEEVTVQLRAATSQVIKSILACHVRGMRNLLRLALTAEAKVPDFYIAEPPEGANGESQLVFGPVYVGITETRKLVIQNHDEVVASFIVDLSDYPAFTLQDGDHRPIEAICAEDDEIPSGPPGQIVIYRPKVELDERRTVDEDEEGKGHMYRVSVNPLQVLSFFLCFTPTTVDVMKSFPLRMSFAGAADIQSPHLRNIIVSGEGKKPRLALNPTMVDFGSRVVVREGTSKNANRMSVKLSNETDAELQWDLDTRNADMLGEVFRVEPVSGKLQPGQSTQVHFIFSPLEVRSYMVRYGVFLDGNKDKRHMEITVKGFGANPSLTFDRKEVILPAVPLDVTTKTTFFIDNEGYETLDLRYKIAGEGKLPITLSFPEGQTITSSHKTLPVEINFVSKKPITFTVNVDFFDDADGIFSIPVTCCADNSLISTFSYLKWRDAGVQLHTEGDRKPIILKEVDEGPTEKDTPRGGGGAKSDSGSTVGGLNDDQGGAFQMLDNMLKKTLSKRAIDRLRTWINVNILPEPVEDMLGALQSNHGRLLYEIIELLFGKPPPGVKIDKQSSKKESTVQVLEQFDTMLLFLKQYGASVSDVRSEYLLRYEEYSRLGGDSLNSSRVSASVSLASAKSSSSRPQRLSERKFLFRAMHAWSSVLFQVLRVFYFSRITWRSFRGLPANSVTQYFAITEKWAQMAQDPSINGSNIYSQPEALLLKWLSIHITQVFGKPVERREIEGGRAGRGGTNINRQDVVANTEAKEYIRLTNFDNELRDCKAFVACLISYIPPLASRFDASKENGLVLQATTALDLERNATLLLDAMKEYGMEVRVSPRELLDFSGRDYLLFTAYLYSTLPQYVPKTTIKFKGQLLKPITKQIELTNPTKWAIDYSVYVENDEFKIAENRFHLRPKETGAFNITITPRFTKKVEGRIMFLSSRSGTFSASTMVFGLETEVETDSSLLTFDNLEIPMYEVLNYEVWIENPYPQYTGHFTPRIEQEYLREANAKQYPEEESKHLFPDAFWASPDPISLKKGTESKAKFVLQFLPSVRGKYRARVVFTEQKIGEFAYTFYATCNPPKPCEVVSFKVDAFQSQTRESLILYKYPAVEKALAMKEERLKAFKGSLRKTTTSKETDNEGREVTYKLEFTNEKGVGPNPFFSAPKAFTLKPPLSEEEEKKRREAGKTVEKSSTAGGQNLPISFNPKGPGQYNGYLLLVSNWDVRIIFLEAKSVSPGLKAELEFSCPARQLIAQEIPITNNSEKDWSISAALTSNDQAFQPGPREIKVPSGRTRPYPLVFNPMWCCDATGTLVLRNNDTGEKYTYNLRGHAEEPLAENTIPVKCKARETQKVEIKVPPLGYDETSYQVETDLPFVSGEPRITVPKNGTGIYTLHVNPQLSGKTTGSISFIAANKQYVWYVITVNVERPPPEDTINISAEVRKGVVCEISMSNPVNKPVEFVVRRKGEGLIGDDFLTLEPNQQNVVYQLAYAPTKAGDFDGVISFNNDDIGEFWYKLSLHAKEAAPQHLNFQCELGKSMSNEVVIENTTDAECHMTVQNSNEVNFLVTPATLVLKAGMQLKATITYIPSAIQSPQDAAIRVSHPKAGAWDFKCRGTGLPPTKMETHHCVAQVNRTSSTSVNFRNPFPVAKRFLATLRVQTAVDASAGSDPHVFNLMSKKQSSHLGPFQIMNIPIAYTPSQIAEHRASVIVQVMEQQDGDLKWEFPIQGVAEASWHDNPARMLCKSRKEFSQVFAFPLVGLNRDALMEQFSHELVVGKEVEYRRAAINSISISPSTKEDYQKELSAKEEQYQHVFYKIVFAPLRPFGSTAEFLIKKATGGMWRYPVHLEASPPDADDIIVIEAAVNVVESVTFNLYNVLPQPKPFMAYFTPDSPQEFTVIPARGVLPAMPASLHEAKESGQPITVSFTSSQYGKTLIGFLVVETEEMQWRYEVRGTLPKYQPPVNVESAVKRMLAEAPKPGSKRAAAQKKH